MIATERFRVGDRVRWWPVGLDHRKISYPATVGIIRSDGPKGVGILTDDDAWHYTSYRRLSRVDAPTPAGGGQEAGDEP